MKQIPKAEREWKSKLTPKQYKILREKGTELPFTGKLLYNKNNGKYVCAGCGNELFSSEKKYNSYSGWPSFFASLKKNSIKETVDESHGVARTEVSCGNCGGHLGHVFNDGPQPTGLRYCINSESLDFKEKKQKKPAKN